MRTSKHARRIGKVLVLLLVALLVDVGLTFALEDYGTPTEITWYNYRALEPASLDTLVVGSSYASFGVDPGALDAELGSHSYNLSTMAQTLPNSLDTLNSVLVDHQLERVILCIGPSSLQQGSQYDREVAFLQAKSLGDSLPDVLHNVATLALDEDNFPTSKSLGWIFPWCYTSTLRSLPSIATNIKNRLNYQNPTDLMEAQGTQWHYLGGGHCAHDNLLDFQTMESDQLALDTAEPFRTKNLREFTALLDTCETLGLPLYVVIAPHPDYANLALQDPDYPELMAGLKDYSEQHGATYLDFNLTRPDCYRPLDADYTDQQHLNVEGSQRFSSALGTLIAEVEAGKDVEGKFFSYDDWDAYLDSYDPIELCYADTTLADGKLTIEAYAIARPDEKVEYEFVVDGEVVQEFSVDDVCTHQLAGEGNAAVEVHARAGSCERTWRHTVTR